MATDVAKYRQKEEEKALPDDFKVKQLEEGIERAEANIKLFSDKVQEQIILKSELEAELAQLKARKNSK